MELNYLSKELRSRLGLLPSSGLRTRKMRKAQGHKHIVLGQAKDLSTIPALLTVATIFYLGRTG